MPYLHIYVSQCGTEQWPRFVVKNNRGEWWTGDKWTRQSDDALMFNSDAEAMAKVTEITLAPNDRLLTTTICLRVDRDKPFTLLELQEFLANNVRGLLLDGDFDGAVFEIDLDVEELREIE